MTERLRIGRDTRNRPVFAAWEELRSTLVCGVSGYGKTQTIVYLCVQAALQGFRLVIADPHGGEAESLAAHVAPLQQVFKWPAAYGEDQALAQVLRFHAELQRRKERAAEYFRLTNTPWTIDVDGDPRLLLVCDEVNGLIRVAGAPLADALKAIAQEGRKFGMYAVLSGQHFTVEALRSSELRAAFASAILHRMDPDMASMITRHPKSKFDTTSLHPGEAYVKLAGRHPSADTPIRLAIPFVEDRDVVLIARQFAESPPLGPRLAPTPMADEEPGAYKINEERRRLVWGEAQRAVNLFEEGAGVAEVGRIICGLKRAVMGRPLMDATRSVEEVLRWEIEHLRAERDALAASSGQAEPPTA